MVYVIYILYFMFVLWLNFHHQLRIIQQHIQDQIPREHIMLNISHMGADVGVGGLGYMLI